MVEKLIFLSCTRLDIKFAVSRLSQFMNNAIEEHVEIQDSEIFRDNNRPRIVLQKDNGKEVKTHIDDILKKKKLILMKIGLSLSMIDIEPQVAAYISGEIDQLVKQEAISGISESHM